jgi:hypothetical protein
MKRWLCGLLIGSFPGLMHAMAETIPCGLYDVVIETTMPHLEENLRYTKIREDRTLTRKDLPRAFPILQHPSLQGCKLGNEQQLADSVTYSLVCEGENTSTGSARWYSWNEQIRGVLNVKFGGKNMTASQRITATSLGKCTSGIK